MPLSYAVGLTDASVALPLPPPESFARTFVLVVSIRKMMVDVGKRRMAMRMPVAYANGERRVVHVTMVLIVRVFVVVLDSLVRVVVNVALIEVQP